jgi:hypothetical protein
VGLGQALVQALQHLLLLLQQLLLAGDLLPGLEQLGLQPPDAVLPPEDLEVLLLAALLGSEELALDLRQLLLLCR